MKDVAKDDLSHNLEMSEPNNQPSSSNGYGCLYLVGTPIGNLEDLTLRSIATLKLVDYIAAEDTRHTGKLLHYLGIQKPQISYHAHNYLSRIPELIAKLQAGVNIALVSDAGMPGISDPGTELVQACIKEKVAICPIPSMTAAITGLTISGLPTERFVFEGFLPVERSPRQARLEALQTEPRTMIFYEAPHRLLRTLTDFLPVFGDQRAIALARELTKRHEECWRGSLRDAVTHYTNHAPRGEFTLILEGAPIIEKEPLSIMELQTALRELLNSGLSTAAASRQLAMQTGLAKRDLYQMALEILAQEDDQS
ncbi:MAG: 16S rRNA (cytidine(1402)-2'-O)-methyltransferase [Pseudanabaena sp. ELA607]